MDDEPWAPRGHEVAWGQLALGSPRSRVAVESAPRDSTAPIVDATGLLSHPLLSASPALCLWRAPTDNDRIGGMGARWAEWGLDHLERELVSIAEHGGATVVTANVRTRAGHVIRHEQTIRAHSGAGWTVDERVVVPAELTDIARVGIVLETIPGLEQAQWFGRGPHESYPDRRRGARVGRWQSSVADLAVPYIRPQENGGRADVRWLELRDATGSGSGLRLAFDRPLQVSATHHSAADLAAAGHDIELVARPETIVHIDVAHRGLGTASCGPDTTAEYLVGPGSYEWSWSMEPVGDARS
ncbi:MAG: hypothetical protein H0V73_12350 [Chloroflexi bacterium]|nr:hypothetical protein [Chloroflexota bacterium]